MQQNRVLDLPQLTDHLRETRRILMFPACMRYEVHQQSLCAPLLRGKQHHNSDAFLPSIKM